MTWALTIPHRGQTTVATRFAMSPLLIYLDEGPGPEDSGTFPPPRHPNERHPIELRRVREGLI